MLRIFFLQGKSTIEKIERKGRKQAAQDGKISRPERPCKTDKPAKNVQGFQASAANRLSRKGKYRKQESRNSRESKIDFFKVTSDEIQAYRPEYIQRYRQVRVREIFQIFYIIGNEFLYIIR